MGTWSKDELRTIAEADDLHIAPFRVDDAYRKESQGDPYLTPMIAAQARSATVKVTSRDVSRLARIDKK